MALAARQHGVLTTGQLASCGLSSRAIARRAARGWLAPVFRGVYRVGPIVDHRAREMAAVLACGESALVSHHSAAAVRGFRTPRSGDVHVTVRGRGVRHRPGITVHSTNRPYAVDAAVNDGVPLTTPARTLHDLAAHLPQHELERAVEEAQVLRLTTRAELQRLEGRPALRRALESEPNLTRSEAERRLLDLIRAARLPPPVANVRAAGFEVDLLWPARRLVVEVDGFAYHGSREAFERDRRRDAMLQAAGYRVVRVTWRQVAGEPHALVARIAQLLPP